MLNGDALVLLTTGHVSRFVLLLFAVGLMGIFGFSARLTGGGPLFIVRREGLILVSLGNNFEDGRLFLFADNNPSISQTGDVVADRPGGVGTACCDRGLISLALEGLGVGDLDGSRALGMTTGF